MVMTATRRSTSSWPVIADPGDIGDQPELERLNLKVHGRPAYVDQHPVQQRAGGCDGRLGSVLAWRRGG